MKRSVLVLACLFSVCTISFAAEQGSVPTSEIPEVKEVIGTGDMILEATYYPQISAVSGEEDGSYVEIDSACESFLSTTRSSKKKIVGNDGPKGRLSKTIPDEDGNSISFKPGLTGLQPITDLNYVVNINPAHIKTAKILVFWTVRVTGTCLPWQISEDVCDTFYAKAVFSCPGNNVNTYIGFTDGTKRNFEKNKHNKDFYTIMKTNPCTLEIPAMTSESNEVQLYDPTITGTYVITKEDFGGVLPDKVAIHIFWENDNSMRIVSPDKMRNMIVNVLPYSRSDK